MFIEVISVTTENIPTAQGSYDKASVAYKDKDGAIKGKNIVSFANKTVYTTLVKAEQGAQFDVKNEKVGNNWNWTAIKPWVEGQSPTPAPSNSSSKKYESTYPTAEERAKTQVHIIRQSSLGHAVAFVTSKSKTAKPEDVIEVAQLFEKFVHGDLTSIEDDIPS